MFSLQERQKQQRLEELRAKQEEEKRRKEAEELARKKREQEEREAAEAAEKAAKKMKKKGGRQIWMKFSLYFSLTTSLFLSLSLSVSLSHIQIIYPSPLHYQANQKAKKLAAKGITTPTEESTPPLASTEKGKGGKEKGMDLEALHYKHIQVSEGLID